MSIHYNDDRVTLHHGDAIEVLRSLPDCSVDSVVTDPPYGLGFMGKKWDAPAEMVGQLATGNEVRGAFAYGGSHSRGYADNDNQLFQQWCEQWARECLRVLKPGGHLLSFGGTRTWHRMVCAIEDAGFEVRDSIAWLYGSGFPKSLNVSKAIDKAAGAEREVIGTKIASPKGISGAENRSDSAAGAYGGEAKEIDITAPATPEAHKWQGWGTALKPAHEPVCVARKPLIGTVAANVLEHGTGALNIDGTRVGRAEGDVSHGGYGNGGIGVGEIGQDTGTGRGAEWVTSTSGRWPANVVLDDYTAEIVDEQSGVSTSPRKVTRGPDRNPSSFGLRTQSEEASCYGDTGGASRFFYCAKAPKRERVKVDGIAHPTVKPLTLMRWLVRLVTPPGGTVLEPFAGSGTTIEAAIQEGFNVIGIEREADYLPLIVARIERNNEQQMVMDA